MSKINFDFYDERYIVAGASSGIGREIALELANAGASVLAIGRNEERLKELRKQNEKNIFSASVDITNTFALEEAIKNFTQSSGKLKGGVFSAGIFGLTPVKSYDHQLAEQIMRVGFWSALEFLRLITKSKYSVDAASIVFLSSIAANTNEKGLLIYSAVKAAINSVVKTAAKEIASKDHRINSICPGWIISPMTEEFLASDNMQSIKQQHLLGLGKTSDVASMTFFLLSDSARWITGANIIVDGGYTS